MGHGVRNIAQGQISDCIASAYGGDLLLYVSEWCVKQVMSCFVKLLL